MARRTQSLLNQPAATNHMPDQERADRRDRDHANAEEAHDGAPHSLARLGLFQKLTQLGLRWFSHESRIVRDRPWVLPSPRITKARRAVAMDCVR